MRLEDQVCSLEYAKRLKELGVRQESVFYWCGKENDVHLLGCGLENYERGNAWSVDDYYSEFRYSAFTVAELIDKTIKPSNLSWIIYYSIRNMEWNIRNNDTVFDGQEWHFVEVDLADALAKMLIHLIEKGIVKP